MGFSAVIAAPFGRLGMQCRDGELIRLDFMPADAPLAPPASGSLEAEVARQLDAYYADPRHVFALPYRLHGTPYQLKVWEQIAAIPCGETRRYLDISQTLASSPRAVGGACGRNPIPLIVPCHRVVASAGLGGFNQSSGDGTLNIKKWLLRHELG
ncbi:methylated-DNA--[protein]-cysteine S-methyltransferase [Chromobacterium sp. IIBBL 290-4]|uniref:methylated-DNA--[protein]-cysteine S-methyltransferase n=1 Tax=Chromobacterium sp. IIBBL 290-4 TaxID=2953890 RepID=UPI0020B8C437|nr:methylated-DNA--[protein]-cysteine S-methyltransferase [Chromobacterium sp. IIBBL 290-4]UTH72423.1 methylated-DNA--[protein]-cysteine S-methyltransferase [Chromobacterium sp. IIBBL 290-4]